MQSLLVSVSCDEFNARDISLNHRVDGITATTDPTSLYVAEIDWLKDKTISTGILTELKIEGKTLSKITFQFPKKD